MEPTRPHVASTSTTTLCVDDDPSEASALGLMSKGPSTFGGFPKNSHASSRGPSGRYEPIALGAVSTNQTELSTPNHTPSGSRRR